MMKPIEIVVVAISLLLARCTVEASCKAPTTIGPNKAVTTIGPCAGAPTATPTATATPSATPTPTPAACIEDTYSETNWDTDLDIFTGARSALGQSFTASFNGDMTTAVWYLEKVGVITGNAVAKLYAHTGVYGTSSVPTGVALATSDNFDVSTLTVFSTLIPFHFSTPFTLVSGTHYVVTIEYTGGDASNYLEVGSNQFGSSHSGNVSSFNGAWSPTPGGWDAIFYAETCWFNGCSNVDDTTDCSAAP